MADIKNIIFDFGGVLFDIDFKKTQDAFKELGFKDAESMYGQYTADNLFENLEKGICSPTTFYEKMMEKSSQNLTVAQIENAWNSMLLRFRWNSFRCLESLQSQYRLFLFSNTNLIHYTAFTGMLREQMPEKKLEDYFEKAWYSYQIHHRKPDREAFIYVLEDKNLKAQETLLIDDSFPNIEAAKQLGMHTRLLAPGEQIENLGL